MSVRIPTAMRSAFEAVKVKRGAVGTPLVKNVLGALMTKIGTRDEGKGWNASLSFKTAEKLKAEGIL